MPRKVNRSFDKHLQNCLIRENHYNDSLDGKKIFTCGDAILPAVIVFATFIVPFFILLAISCPIFYVLKNKFVNFSKILKISEKVLPFLMASFVSSGVASVLPTILLIIIIRVMTLDYKKVKGNIEKCKNSEFSDRFVENFLKLRELKVEEFTELKEKSTEQKGVELFDGKGLQGDCPIQGLCNDVVGEIIDFCEFEAVTNLSKTNKWFLEKGIVFLNKRFLSLTGKEADLDKKRLLESYIKIHENKSNYERLKALIFAINVFKKRINTIYLKKRRNAKLDEMRKHFKDFPEDRLECYVEYKPKREMYASLYSISNFLSFLNLNIIIFARNFNSRYFLENFPKLEILKINSSHKVFLVAAERPWIRAQRYETSDSDEFEAEESEEEEIIDSYKANRMPEHEEGFFCFLNPLLKTGVDSYSEGRYYIERAYQKSKFYDHYRDLLKNPLKILHIENEDEFNERALKDMLEFFLYVPSLEKIFFQLPSLDAFFEGETFNPKLIEGYFKEFEIRWKKPVQGDPKDEKRIDVVCENVFQKVTRELKVSVKSIDATIEEDTGDKVLKEISLKLLVADIEKEIVFIRKD